jgi:hypothetical protein
MAKTWGMIFDEACCCTAGEAQPWLEVEVDRYVEEFGGSRQVARQIIKSNIKYFAGYCDFQTVQKMCKLFNIK